MVCSSICYNISVKIQPPFYRVSIKALISDTSQKFLLCQEENGYWGLPGGGLELHETQQDCLTREIYEEMGLQIVQVDFAPSYVIASPHLSGEWTVVEIIYRAQVENLHFKPSNECVAIDFFDTTSAAALPKKLSDVNAFIGELQRQHTYVIQSSTL
jgi:ADP-ribose pyrophosphatase YjhB (NUDIX family)